MEGTNTSVLTAQVSLTFLAVLVLVVPTITASAQPNPSEPQSNTATTQGNPANAQASPGSVQAAATPGLVAVAPTDEVEKRIERARALAAAHQLAAAARELESVRATTADAVLRYGTSIMLMGIYLEDGNYSRAQSLLEESFQARATANNNSVRNYFALAGQAVNGAREHVARYGSFGVNISAAILPPEALNDLERLRVLLERMVAQAKEIVREAPKASDGLALLEDVLGVRASLARDNQDRNRWQTEYAQARAELGFARMQLVSNVESPIPPRSGRGGTQLQTNDNPKGGAASAKIDITSQQIIYAGVLNPRASKRVVPVYPQLAQASGAAGMVKVHVVVDESGSVQVTRSEGPALLKQAAEEAARGWSFLPLLVDGKPVRFTGYIEFSFEL